MNTCLDEVWYEKLKKVGGFTPYYYFAIDRNEVGEKKNKFLNNELDELIFRYPKLDDFSAKRKRDGLLSLKNEIDKFERNKVVARLYREKIEEYLLIVDLVEAAKNGDHRVFALSCGKLYGEMNLSYFKDVVSEVLVKATSMAGGRAPGYVQKSSRKLIEMFQGWVKLSDPVMMDRSLINRLCEKISSKMLTGINSKQAYKAEEMVEFFSKALRDLKLSDWKVSVDESDRVRSITVSQSHKKLKIPAKRRLTGEELKGKVVHEIGVHVLRRKNGEKSRLRLLGLGLEKYLIGEEGVASVLEQAVKLNYMRAGGVAYFALGLGGGLDGVKRNFRDVFCVLYDYYILLSYRSGVAKNEVEQMATDRAWKRCLRIYRGTDFGKSGVCFTKDKLYREGNVKIWNLLKEDFGFYNSFDVGKFDPANSWHRKALSELGIDLNCCG